MWVARKVSVPNAHSMMELVAFSALSIVNPCCAWYGGLTLLSFLEMTHLLSRSVTFLF